MVTAGFGRQWSVRGLNVLSLTCFFVLPLEIGTARPRPNTSGLASVSAFF